MGTRISVDYFRAKGVRDAPMKEQLLRLFLGEQNVEMKPTAKAATEDDHQERIVLNYLKLQKE